MDIAYSPQSSDAYKYFFILPTVCRIHGLNIL